MPPRIVTSEGNVTRLHHAADLSVSAHGHVHAPAHMHEPRAEVARYIGQMVLDLERMANTANLDLLAYFLAMARAEADTIANVPDTSRSGREAQTQAPYRAD